MKPQDENRKLREYIRQSRQRRRWRRLTAVLATAAAVLTLCVMVLPAVTMESTPQTLDCQLDLHTHTDSCYDEEGELLCGYAGFAAHTHDSSCYGEDGTLICPLEERKPHTHTESCYQETEALVCGLEETQGHTHSEACYETQLVCGQEESQGHTHTGHVHTEECYTVTQTPICESTEPDHVHTEECSGTHRELTCTQDTGCYDENGNLVCGLEETQGHTHSEACYDTQLVCGQEETEPHTHTDSCYQVQRELVCGQEEVVLHTHTEDCWDEDGNLTCGMLEIKEHVHDETCLPETASEPEDISQPEDSSAEESQTEESQTEESQTEESQTEESQTEESQTEESQTEESQTEESQTEESQTGESQTEEDQEAVSQSGTSWATVSKPGYEPAAENGVALFSAKALLAEPLAETSYDFAEDIVSITVEKQQGSQWIQGDKFTDGDTIRVTIRYEIPTGVITVGQTTMHYQLPGGIALEKEETGSVYLEDGTKAGTYTISENGRITIVFEREFANGEAFSGSLQFQGSIALADVVGGQEIEFGGTGEIITVVPEEKNYSLIIEKIGVYVRDEDDARQYEQLKMGIDIQPKKLLYTIEVRADDISDGSNDTITVTDKFTHTPADGVVTYDANNIKVLKISTGVDGTPSPVEITGYGLEIYQQTGTDDGQTSSFTISGLPALQPGERYSINYTATIDFTTVHSPTGYIEVPNMATATDKSQDVSANAKVGVSQRMVYKEGKLNTGTGNVQWTVNINEDGRDISGMTFKDTMTYMVNNQTLPYDLNKIVNLQVTAYSGGTRQGDVTGLFTGLLSYEEGVLSVTFPQNKWPEGLDSTWTYYITYETPYPDGVEIGEDIYFHNTAQLGEYTATAYWNGNVPEQGYGLVKRSTGDNLNTGTDVGTVNWQSTLSYPSGITETDLGQIEYRDWIVDVYYEDSGQFIDGSHYTTLTTLKESLWITNAQGTKLLWGKDFTVNVVYADAMPQYGTFEEAWKNTGEIFAQKLTDVTTAEGSDTPIAFFCIKFTENSLEKLAGGQQLYITYRTLVDRKGVTDGRTVNIDNVGAILGHTVQTGLETAFHPRLQKQVKTDGMAPSGDDFQLNSDIWSDEADLDLGDTGGRLYYRILFYNYTDEIQFYDDMLQEFYQLAHGTDYIAFDSQLRIYNAATGKLEQTVKIWGAHMDNNGQYNGNYRLYDLSQFKDCIIGLYYSINVSGDEALADLAEGETHAYTNTVEWTGIGKDSTTANVTNSEQTLKKVGVQTDENGETLVTYYVVINPEGRNLHPESDALELRDTLSLPNGVTADLRLETIGLYHYDPLQDNNLGLEVTKNEFADFRVELEDGTANTYTFTVPDEMACVVMYTYQIHLGTSALEEIPVSNTASLLGRAVIAAGDEVVIQAQDSSAQVNKATLTIYKYGGDNRANLLQDVLFDLDRYEQKEDGTYGWVRTAITAKGQEDKNGKHFITGGDGVTGAIILNFLDEGKEGGSHYNTLYRLTEYKTLDGYELNMTPHYYVWGEANATKEETAAAMAEVLAATDVNWEDVMFIPFGESETDYIQNLPTTTKITVEKQWQGAEGTELEEGEHPDEVKVTLYQVSNDGTKTEYKPEGVENPVTLNADNHWTYTWEQLPKEDEGKNPVTYTVEETPIDGWEARYVDEKGEETTGITEGTIQIINTKQSTFTLPETGGVGPTLVAIAGVPLIGAAGVVYRNLRRKRRRGGKLP